MTENMSRAACEVHKRQTLTVPTISLSSFYIHCLSLRATQCNMPHSSSVYTLEPQKWALFLRQVSTMVPSCRHAHTNVPSGFQQCAHVTQLSWSHTLIHPVCLRTISKHMVHYRMGCCKDVLGQNWKCHKTLKRWESGDILNRIYCMWSFCCCCCFPSFRKEF